MKTILAILCLFLVGCTTPAPTPIEAHGNFTIIEYSMPGTIKQSWRVTEYRETEFPRTVTFVANGKTITLSGSYQINQFFMK